MIEIKELINVDCVKDIIEDDFNIIKLRDINLFLGDYCSRYYKNIEKNILIFENNNRVLVRKKLFIFILFKFLYRNF